MNIRAKISVESVTKHAHGSEEINARGVYDSKNPENNSFAKATPCLNLTMTIDNPAAQGVLQAGKDYYIDFTPAS